MKQSFPSTPRDETFASIADLCENPRLKRSLVSVKEACDFLEQSKAPITPTAVGRYCESKWGSPKAQSIRNAKNTLFAYLQVRQSKQIVPTVVKGPTFEPSIADETVRAYITIIKTERDEAIRAKNRVVNGLRSIPGIDIDELLAAGFKGEPAKTIKQRDVSEAAKTALIKLLNSANLEKVGLELFRDRLRHIQTKEILLDKADIEALRGTLVGSPQD